MLVVLQVVGLLVPPWCLSLGIALDLRSPLMLVVPQVVGLLLLIVPHMIGLPLLSVDPDFERFFLVLICLFWRFGL